MSWNRSRSDWSEGTTVTAKGSIVFHDSSHSISCPVAGEVPTYTHTHHYSYVTLYIATQYIATCSLRGGLVGAAS